MVPAVEFLFLDCQYGNYEDKIFDITCREDGFAIEYEAKTLQMNMRIWRTTETWIFAEFKGCERYCGGIRPRQVACTRCRNNRNFLRRINLETNAVVPTALRNGSTARWNHHASPSSRSKALLFQSPLPSSLRWVPSLSWFCCHCCSDAVLMTA
jgi:hypothetical protein